MPRRVGDTGTGASGYGDVPAQPDELNSGIAGNTGARGYDNVASQQNALYFGGAGYSQAMPPHAMLEGLMSGRWPEGGAIGGSFGYPAATYSAMQAPNPSFVHAQAPVRALPATVPTSSIASESATKNLLSNAWIAPELTGIKEPDQRIVSQAMAVIRSGSYQNMDVRRADNQQTDVTCSQFVVGQRRCGASIRLDADGRGALDVVSFENFNALVSCNVSWALTSMSMPTSESYDKLAPGSRDRLVIDALTVAIEQNGAMPSHEWQNLDGSLTRIFEGVEACGRKWYVSSNRPLGQSLYIVARAGVMVIAVHINDPSTHAG